MNFLKLLYVILIVFSTIYSSENKNFNLTFEGFDDFYIGLGRNRNKFHLKFRLGLDYTRNKYKDVISINILKTSIGVNSGFLILPVESIELIPSIGFNFKYRIEWMSSYNYIPEAYHSYKLGPNANITVYKLFDSFIIGGSIDLLFLHFERTPNKDWNKIFEVSFKPHFIIGFRF